MNAVTTLEPMIALENVDDLIADEAAPSPAPVPKPRKPRVWPVFVLPFVAMFLGQIATNLVVFSILGCIQRSVAAQGGDPATAVTQFQELLQMPLAALLISLIPYQLAMACVMLFAAWLSKEPIRERLGLVPQTGRRYGIGKLAMMVCFTFAAAHTVIIGFSVLAGPPPAGDPLSTAINANSILTVTIVGVVLSVVPILVEECLFRGYVQRRLLKRWSPAVAITVSTLLFSMMHIDSLMHQLAVIPLGIVTGLLAYRTNSVKASMVVHCLHNVAAVGVGALIPVVAAHCSNEAFGLGMLGTVAVLGLIGLPAVISLLRRTKPQPAVESDFVPAPVVESPSVLRRELGLPDYATDSRLASQAV